MRIKYLKKNEFKYLIIQFSLSFIQVSQCAKQECADNVPCTSAEHALNRRTESIVIE